MTTTEPTTDTLITITTPTSGSTVPLSIPCAGTYASKVPPTITVELKDSGGNTVATATATLSNGTWTATLVAPQDYEDASIEAVIDGTAASASVGGLTVTCSRNLAVPAGPENFV